MLRTSKHTIKFANTNKIQELETFLQEYHRVIQTYIDYLWNNNIIYSVNKKLKDSEEIIQLTKTLNISKEQYDCPTMLVAEFNNLLNLQINLSARALKCCSTQACSMVRAVLEKPKRRQYVYQKLLKEGKDTVKIEKKIKEQKITKPEIKNIKAELNSICCDFIFKEIGFDGFLQLKCLGKSFDKIRIPIKFHRQALKWKSQGKIMTSFLISNKAIEIRWEVPNKELVTKGETIGVDQGMLDVATLSNEIVTPKEDKHGHSLESILDKMSRKKKGSKAFAKTQEHRKNFINWSVNQLNFKNIKQINLEKIVNIRYKKRSSRLLSHWTNTLIRDKFIKNCEESGVQIKLQSSTYRSQRCFNCGWVQRTNRKGKKFCCKRCKHQSDADLNAAKNHSIELPDVPRQLRIKKLNKKGFYWEPDGFTLDGEKLTVSLPQEKS
jgi:transposase